MDIGHTTVLHLELQVSSHLYIIIVLSPISGYIERFGLHQVDFNDPNRKRTPRASAKFYTQLIKDNGFPK